MSLYSSFYPIPRSSSFYSLIIRKIQLIIFFLCTYSMSFAQEYDNYYPFNKIVLNLKNLQIEESLGEISVHFKTKSKFSHRFSDTHIYDNTEVNKDNICIQKASGNSLEILNLKTGKKHLIPKSTNHQDERTLLLFEAKDGAVHIREGLAHYRVELYNKNGRLISDKTIKPKQSLSYFDHSPTKVIFSPWKNRELGSYNRTHIINLENGQEEIIPYTINGLILDEKNDQEIIGYCTVDADQSLLEIQLNGENFNLTVPRIFRDDRIKTIYKDGWLIICSYDSQDSGAKLFAIDIESQKVAWQASTTRLSNHDGFYTQINILSEKDGKIIMESLESKGDLLQIFDIRTGRKLFEHIAD